MSAVHGSLEGLYAVPRKCGVTQQYGMHVLIRKITLLSGEEIGVTKLPRGHEKYEIIQLPEHLAALPPMTVKVMRLTKV